MKNSSTIIFLYTSALTTCHLLIILFVNCLFCNYYDSDTKSKLNKE